MLSEEESVVGVTLADGDSLLDRMLLLVLALQGALSP